MPSGRAPPPAHIGPGRPRVVRAEVLPVLAWMVRLVPAGTSASSTARLQSTIWLDVEQAREVCPTALRGGQPQLAVAAPRDDDAARVPHPPLRQAAVGDAVARHVERRGRRARGRSPTACGTSRGSSSAAPAGAGPDRPRERWRGRGRLARGPGRSPSCRTGRCRPPCDSCSIARMRCHPAARRRGRSRCLGAASAGRAP